MANEEVPEALREAVDQVSEHLCALRGGGAFLSSVDGLLLVDWLQAGIPTAVISVALERVAERRRRRRVKAPLALRSCKAEVKRLWARGLPTGAAAPAPPSAPDSEGADPLFLLQQQALSRLDALPAGQPELRAERAMAIVRGFHLQAWELAKDQHEALREQAAVDLQDLREGFEPGQWQAALDEVARDLLRQRYPRLSAVAVWDRLHGS